MVCKILVFLVPNSPIVQKISTEEKENGNYKALCFTSKGNNSQADM